MQRVGFRLSQAERGYGENYDLAGKYLLEDQKIFNHHSHHALHVVLSLCSADKWSQGRARSVIYQPRPTGAPQKPPSRHSIYTIYLLYLLAGYLLSIYTGAGRHCCGTALLSRAIVSLFCGSLNIGSLGETSFI